MNSPVRRDTNLTIAERQGIEIDNCLQCRGVWPDGGASDKLIEQAARAAADRPRPDCRERPDYDDAYRRKRPKSFLRDLFD